MYRLFIIISFLFILISSPSWASSVVNVDLTNLSESSRNEILNKLKQNESLNIDSVSKISTISSEISKSIKEIAQNLNIEVNNFAKTPVGIMTFGLLIWHYAGQTVISSIFGFVTGFMIWIIGTFLILYIARRTFLASKFPKIKYDPTTGRIESKEYVLVIPTNSNKDAWELMTSVAYCIFTAVMIIIMFG